MCFVLKLLSYAQNFQAVVAGVGDTIGLLVNIDEGSLTVFLNKSRIVRFADLFSQCSRPKLPLRWTTTLEEEGDAVRISNLTGRHLDVLLDAERELLVLDEGDRPSSPPLWDFQEVRFDANV